MFYVLEQRSCSRVIRFSGQGILFLHIEYRLGEESYMVAMFERRFL